MFSTRVQDDIRTCADKSVDYISPVDQNKQLNLPLKHERPTVLFTIVARLQISAEAFYPQSRPYVDGKTLNSRERVSSIYSLRIWPKPIQDC